MDGLDFVVVGLAQCFLRDEENQLTPVLMIEPVPSAAFLALLQDIPSSFSRVMAIDPSQMLLQQDGWERPQGFPLDAQFPNDFHERLIAAARTFLHKPEAREHLALGQSITIEKSPKDKRIINQTNVVCDNDNIKQHPLTHQKI